VADPRAKDLLFDALELDPSERAAFLDRECAGDLELRGRVEALLAAHGDAEDRMGTPPTVRMPPEARAAVGPALHPGDEVGPYRLEAVLGEGGFGTVFRARQEQPVRRDVALKVLKPGMDSAAVLARFEAERQVLALMDHPHIARVLDAGSTPTGLPYVVMELVDGRPITEACEQRSVSVEERLTLFALVCRAVQHAHGKGVIHRDIKPGNVLVTEVDGRLEPKVIDFGVAKAVRGSLVGDATLTHAGHVVGTPAAMSPEQVEGSADVDTRTDVYSLGVLLYELLAGCPPFDLEDAGLAELCRMVREVDPPRPGDRIAKGTAGDTAVGSLPLDVDWIVMRCLEKERERRYPTAWALAQDVERFLEGLPVEAAPPSAFYRVRKLARRHRAASVAAGVALLALVVGVTGLITGLLEAGRANAALEISLGETQAEAERARLAEILAGEKAAEARAAELLAEREARAARKAEAEAQRQTAFALGAEFEATRQAELAREQAEVARAVLAFVTDDLLAAAAPSNRPGEGRDVMLSDVLDVAGRRLESGAATDRFGDAPLVEAGVRHALGSTLSALGRYPEADRHLRQALVLRIDHLGDDHLETLNSMVALARAISSHTVHTEALTLMRRAHERLVATRGATDGRTLEVAVELSLLLWDDGAAEEAMTLLDGAVLGLSELSGPESPAALHARMAMGLLIHALGYFDEAENMVRQVVDARMRLLGADDPVTLATQVNLANILRGSGHLTESEDWYAAALAGYREVMGSGHADALMAGQGLGRLWTQQGRLPEAEALLAELLDEALITLDPSHALCLELTAALGRAIEMQGRYDEALVHYRSAYDGALVSFGPDHTFTLGRAKEVGSIYFATGRLDEALPLMRDVLAGEQEAVGPLHASTLQAQMNVAIVLIGLQRWDEAEEEMRGALDGLRGSQGPDAIDTLEVQSNLVGLLLERRQWEEALDLADDGLPRLLILLPDDALQVLILRVRRAVALTHVERFEEAEEELLASQLVLEATWPGTPFATDAMIRLQELYDEWGRPADAEVWAARVQGALGG
jgi:serine/threonine protein kinase/tetratricopeptide (TPR) repeat protein